MRPIPPQLREQIAADPFMKRCIYPWCGNWPEWEHAFEYSGRQINEAWAIVPVCTYHHRGAGLVKDYNQYRAIIRADLADLEKRMPKKDWQQIYKYLTQKYDKGNGRKGRYQKVS